MHLTQTQNAWDKIITEKNGRNTQFSNNNRRFQYATPDNGWYHLTNNKTIECLTKVLPASSNREL